MSGENKEVKPLIDELWQESGRSANLALELLAQGLAPKGSARRLGRIGQDSLLPKRAGRRAKKVQF